MRRVLVAAGVLLMAYAVIGAVTEPGLKLIGLLVFLAAVVVLHDGVLAPAVLAAGALIDRFVPEGARPAVRVAAVCGLAVTVVAIPLALGP